MKSGCSREALLQDPICHGDNGGLRSLRGYLTSVGAHRTLGERNHLADWRFFLANPSFRRFFSSESPNKKSKRDVEFQSDLLFCSVVVLIRSASFLGVLIFLLWCKFSRL